MCFGCGPVLVKGLSELDKLRLEAASYAQTFGIDVVVVKMNGEYSFHQETPEESEEIEWITKRFSINRV